jgi:hypothetical protein
MGLEIRKAAAGADIKVFVAETTKMNVRQGWIVVESNIWCGEMTGYLARRASQFGSFHGGAMPDKEDCFPDQFGAQQEADRINRLKSDAQTAVGLDPLGEADVAYFRYLPPS